MIRMGVAEQMYITPKGLVMRLIYAIKAVFYILLSGEDAIDMVERMYEWTDHKETSWAIRAARLIGRAKP